MPNRALVIVLGCLGIVLVAAVVLIVIFYDGDKGLAIGGLVTAAGLVIPGLLSLKQSADNAGAIEQTRVAVDGRMEQLLATVKHLAETQGALDSADARAEGLSAGRKEGEHVVSTAADVARQTTETAGVVAAQVVRDARDAADTLAGRP